MNAKKKRISKKTKQLNKTYDILSVLLTILVVLYIIIMEFTDYHATFIYIPIEILILIVISSDYFIYKKGEISDLNSFVLVINATALAYFFLIEIVLIPLTFKTANNAYIYKQVYAFLLEHENALVPILIILGGTFLFPGLRAIYHNEKRPLYSLLLTIGIILITFGLAYTGFYKLISSYM